ncbi:MAG TPA: hypothetical protein VMV04_10405 [Thermodesulfobacteriota bacterium]|nr:hypothetical protein [Thermodesulfobacteriota bacterium]
MMEEICCTQCRTPILAAYYNTSKLISCPSCHAPIRIDVFPAFYHGLQPGKEGETLMDDQASCFYHPQKKAVIPCDHCGRFLCALCDVEFGGKHLCPACMETGKKKGRIVNLDRQRVLYDSVALKLAVFPMIIFYFTLVTAPIALYLAIHHWKSPTSLVRRTKIRFIFAMALAGLQILAWTTGIVYLVSRR